MHGSTIPMFSAVLVLKISELKLSKAEKKCNGGTPASRNP
jgi:hypothetical protein